MIETKAGQVWAHVGQPFTAGSYDVIVLGAGRMGASLAYYLRQLWPKLRLLLVEEGGLPNEEGATILAAGIWSLLDLPPHKHQQANWVRAQLEQIQLGLTRLTSLANPKHSNFHGIGLRNSTLLSFFSTPEPQAISTTATSTTAALNQFPEIAAWIDPQVLPSVQTAEAMLYRPASLALTLTEWAIKMGADLMLNTRAILVDGGVMLERLTITNTHQIVTHETHHLRAGQIIVALGAGGPEQLEQDLGIYTAHAKAYQQFPRLNVPTTDATTDATPVLRAYGLTLRPQHGGFSLISAIHHRDPYGYVPMGGRLTGVPTGLRRETLEDLVAAMDGLPLLATASLQLGRSLSDIAGAWVSLPEGKADGLPLWERVNQGMYLLLGGPKADTLGLAVAYDLALALGQGQIKGM